MASDKINITQLAKMFGLPDWDDIDEMNQQYYWEQSRGAEDPEAAEQEARDEVFHRWYDAVEHVANELFEAHGLELHGIKKGRARNAARPYEFKIVPMNSWNDAANKIRETINGIGDFYFPNLQAFLRSGPYTAKQAVIGHLRAITKYPAVYGGHGARQMYEAAWRP